MELAPDGSVVIPLTRTKRYSSALFFLEPGQITRAVYHRHVEEVWHITQGKGELWRARQDCECNVVLMPGQTVEIPAGVRFQFKAASGMPLRIFGVTVPPWPLDVDDEVVFVEGPWPPTER